MDWWKLKWTIDCRQYSDLLKEGIKQRRVWRGGINVYKKQDSIHQMGGMLKLNQLEVSRQDELIASGRHGVNAASSKT